MNLCMMASDQVPATWFASDAGIRRLVLPETALFGGRFCFSDHIFGPVRARALSVRLVRGLGRLAHGACCMAERALCLDEGVDHVGLVGLLVVRHQVADLFVVALDVIGDHQEGSGRIARHVAQSARAGMHPCPNASVPECIRDGGGSLGNVTP